MSTRKKHLLLIFLKEPIPGKVKTRLASTVGDEMAVRIYKSLVSVLLEQLKWIKDTHYRFCFSPQDAEEAMLHWILPELEHRLEEDGSVRPLTPEAASVDFKSQCAGGLGERLEDAFQTGFNEGYEEVSAIGTDCPYLSARWIETAHLVGRKNDLVLGPVHDGGYCFISLKSFTPVPFRDIPWSAAETLSSTVTAIENANLSHMLLPTLSDIDHESDWNEALESTLGGRLRKTLKRHD